MSEGNVTIPDLTLPAVNPPPAANGSMVSHIDIRTYEDGGVTKVSFQVFYVDIYKDESTGAVTRLTRSTQYYDGDISNLSGDFAQYQGTVNAVVGGVLGICAAIKALGKDR